ncbi:MAG: DUF3551 domain-containing protein [Xanthobacteraceae bacterium]|jgi:hypothetical protein
MRFLLILGLAITAASFATRTEAQNYPWCAHNGKDGGMDCGFTSFQQCLVDISGLGGFCEPNNTYKPAVSAAPAGRRALKRRPQKPAKAQLSSTT